MWWLYFTLPSAEVLHRHRRLGFRWGYAHIAVFMTIAATGAGLHVAAYFLEHDSAWGPVGVVAATAVPVAAFGLCLGALYGVLVGVDRTALINGLAALVLLGAAVVLAALGVGVPWCLLVVMLAPVPTILSDERVLARRREERLAALEAQ
jgi:low temperature requirement protein LtrA